MKPCRYCGEPLTTTSKLYHPHCLAARKYERYRAWLADNAERRREYNREWMRAKRAEKACTP